MSRLPSAGQFKILLLESRFRVFSSPFSPGQKSRVSLPLVPKWQYNYAKHESDSRKRCSFDKKGLVTVLGSPLPPKVYKKRQSNSRQSQDQFFIEKGFGPTFIKSKFINKGCYAIASQ